MIAREAHITPSLLQKYYPTKEDVLAAFVERALDELDGFTTGAQKAIATTSGVRALLRKIGLSYVAFLNRMRGFYLTWMMCPETIAPYRDTLPDFITLNHHVLAGVLANRLHISHEDAIDRTRVFFSSIFAWVMYYSRVASRKSVAESPSARVERLIEHLVPEEKAVSAG